VTKLGNLGDLNDQELHTKIWNCMWFLDASHRKILNVVHLSSMMSCCVNEVVEKGRVVQISEDPCILVV